MEALTEEIIESDSEDEDYVPPPVTTSQPSLSIRKREGALQLEDDDDETSEEANLVSEEIALMQDAVQGANTFYGDPGAGPSNAGSSIVPGPSSAGAGPSSAGAGPSSAGAGPSSAGGLVAEIPYYGDPNAGPSNMISGSANGFSPDDPLGKRPKSYVPAPYVTGSTVAGPSVAGPSNVGAGPSVAGPSNVSAGNASGIGSTVLPQKRPKAAEEPSTDIVGNTQTAPVGAGRSGSGLQDSAKNVAEQKQKESGSVIRKAVEPIAKKPRMTEEVKGAKPKSSIDDIWAQMNAGSKQEKAAPVSNAKKNDLSAWLSTPVVPAKPFKVKRLKDLEAEAAVEAAKNREPMSKRRTGLEEVLDVVRGKSDRAIEKTRQQWSEFKDEKGHEHELESYKKDRNRYTDKVSFLKRTDVREWEFEQRGKKGRR